MWLGFQNWAKADYYVMCAHTLNCLEDVRRFFEDIWGCQNGVWWVSGWWVKNGWRVFDGCLNWIELNLLSSVIKYNYFYYNRRNMHHKYDVSSKDALYIIDLAGGIFFKFRIISKEAHFVPSLCLLILLMMQNFQKKISAAKSMI